MYKIIVAIFFLLAQVNLTAQQLFGVGTRWNDSFKEWVLYTDIEGEEGHLRLIWRLDDDWSAWEYRLGEAAGTIKLKWKDNPNEWELRGDNVIVTARTVWNNNFQEWRINDGHCTLTLRSRYGNILEDWESRTSGCGYWGAYTSFEGDVRDWVIDSGLEHETSFHLSMMATFITIFHSTPKI